MLVGGTDGALGYWNEKGSQRLPRLSIETPSSSEDLQIADPVEFCNSKLFYFCLSKKL